MRSARHAELHHIMKMQDPEEIIIKANHLTESAIKYMESGDNEHAFKCYRDAFKLLVNVGTSQQVLSCACNYGASCLVTNRADEAIDLLEKYLQNVGNTHRGDDNNFITLIGDVHYNLALAYNVKYQFELAISHLNHAIKIFQEQHVIAPLAESYQQLGDVCAKAGRERAALEAYSHAARTYREDKDMVAQGKTYIKIAKMYIETKEKEECLKQLNKCEQICALLIENGQKFGKSKRLIFDLAMTFKKIKEHDKVIKWLEKAEGSNLPNKPNNEEGHLHAVIVENLGKMYIETRNYINAVEKYQKAAAYYGQLGNMKPRAWCFYHLGGIFLTLKDWRNAEKCYNMACQMLEVTGNVSHLWKIKEGLGDLHTITYQYTAAVTYYKETLILSGIHSSRNVLNDQKRIVDKLTAVLDSQKNGGKRDNSYSSRKPVVLPMVYDTSLAYNSNGLPPVPSIVKGPVTSSPLGSEESSKHRKSRKGKEKKGRKRADMLMAPVPTGVSEYDSSSDMSLMEREMRKQLILYYSLNPGRSHSLPKSLGNTYEVPDGDTEEKHSRQNRQASQGNVQKGKQNDWKGFGREASVSSSACTSSSGLETISANSHHQSTSGTQTIPLYATIDRKQTSEMQGNLSTNKSTNGTMSSTMPSRWAPDPPEPPPTLPPNHPSFVEHRSDSSEEESQQYLEKPVMNNLSRSQREAELYAVASNVEEFRKPQECSSHQEYRRQVEQRKSSVPNSRMCLVT